MFPVTETAIIAGVAIMAAGWIINTWLRMKHGYPLENSRLRDQREKTQ